MLYDKNSHGAKAYKSLADEVIERNSLKTLELGRTNETDTVTDIDNKETGGADGETESIGQGPTGINT